MKTKTVLVLSLSVLALLPGLSAAVDNQKENDAGMSIRVIDGKYHTAKSLNEVFHKVVEQIKSESALTIEKRQREGISQLISDYENAYREHIYMKLSGTETEFN